jgi:hypothetical protein
VNVANVRGSATNYVADFVMERVTEKRIGEVRQDIIVDTTINPRLADAVPAMRLTCGAVE